MKRFAIIFLFIYLLFIITGCGTVKKMTEDNNNSSGGNRTVVTHTLNISILGMGNVEITPASSDGKYTDGTTVTLTAIPDYGWAFFNNWQGEVSGNTVTLDKDQAVTVNFTHLT